MTMAPVCGKIVDMVPEIHVRPEMLRVLRYIEVLACVIYNCMHSTEQQLNYKAGATRVCHDFHQ